MHEKCAEIDAELIQFNGETDHVHLLVNFPAKISISQLVRLLKGVSSRLLRKEFALQIKDKLWKDHFWSPSYCAVTAGGAPLKVIKKYIENQKRPATENQQKMCIVAPKVNSKCDRVFLAYVDAFYDEVILEVLFHDH